MNKIAMTLLSGLLASTLSAAEYRREITKEFDVRSDPSLSIENKYGDVRLIEGTENKILFKIEIIGKGVNEAHAKEYAESVSIDFAHDGNRVSAKTVLPSLNCAGCGRTIHYVVVAPKSVIPTLTNKYGNILLDNVIKPLKVDLKYGNLQTGALTEADVDLKYGKANIHACDVLKMDSKYSGLEFGKIGTLSLDSKYDHIRIDAVTDFRLDAKYAKVKIGRLNQSLITDDLDYCALEISEVAVSFSKIRIDAAYTQVKIALNKAHSFDAKLYTKYGNIKTGELTFGRISLLKNDVIVGRAGNDDHSKAEVEISVSYGGITFID